MTFFTVTGVARLVCVGVLLYAAFHSIWGVRRSLLDNTQLCKLDYMPVEYFEKKRIQSFTFVSFIVCIGLSPPHLGCDSLD